MNRVFLFLVLAGAVFSDYVPNEVLVKLREKKIVIQSSSVLSIEALFQDEAIYKLKLEKGSDIFEVIDELKKDPNVEYAEPNYIRRIQKMEEGRWKMEDGRWTEDRIQEQVNDPYFSNQWGLLKIKAPSVWDVEKGNSSIVIAILDTGIDYKHPDLDVRVINGWDFASNDNDSMDDNGHGTHVAGIAGAETNNGTGCAGVTWGCNLLAVKCLDKDGYGSDDKIYLAIRYAADYGVRVINMSFGEDEFSQTLEDACDYAYKKGVFLVAAAGNSGESKIFYPAGYESVMAVAATDSDDRRAYFSQYGNWVDIAAPGVYILSTIPNNKYASSNGTSMASPFVAGLAGLMFSRYKGTANAWVFSEIQRLSDRIDIEINGGRINAYKAICGTNTKPSAFSLIQPTQDGWTSSVYPLFKWQKSYDPDWGDEITYRFFLGMEGEGMKEVANMKDSLITGDYCLWMPDYKNPLLRGKIYNWMVVAGDSSGGTYSTPVSTFTTTFITVFPNPAKNGQVVRFRGIPLTRNTCFVLIYTLAGELVEKIPQGKGEDVLWDTKPVSSGVYLYIISNLDKTFAKGKIGVIK